MNNGLKGFGDVGFSSMQYQCCLGLSIFVYHLVLVSKVPHIHSKLVVVYIVKDQLEGYQHGIDEYNLRAISIRYLILCFKFFFKGYMNTCMLLHITSLQCMKLVFMHNNLDMQT
jgi:hypothetical protein